MSDPSFRPLNTGDVNDDDPMVIDSLVEQAPEPPAPVVEPIVTVPLPEPKTPTRILSVSQLIDNTWTEPTLILPEDLNRENLRIRCYSPTTVATDGFRVSSDKRYMTGPILRHNTSLDLSDHTGALWASALGASAPLLIEVWSVTK